MFWADLHLHSPHSIATSRAMTPEAVAASALRKGLGLVATGDALHPAWLDLLEERLAGDGSGFLRLRSAGSEAPRFVAGGEVNCVWRHEGRGRRVHLLYLLPGLAEARRLAHALSPYGKLASDGRPSLRLSAAHFIEAAHDAAPGVAVLAAHVWTPWFGLLGARAGFSSLAEALGGAAKGLCAVETGLSSDPGMCRRVSFLDGHPAVSFSDAHGPAALGREATRFCGVSDFSGLVRALSTGEGLVETLEFFPAEGKYFHDGHRACGVSSPPRADGGLCPVCGRPLTPGVLGRVDALADRAEEEALRRALPQRHAVPLAELAALALGKGKASKAVREAVDAAVDAAGSELAALLEADPRTLGDERLAAAVFAMREGKLEITPGYDGEYGKIRFEGARLR